MTRSTLSSVSSTSRVPRDAELIIAARGARSFAYGLLGVLLGVALSREGISPGAIGALITSSLVGDFCGTYAVGVFADHHWGRRRTLFILALLMAATGTLFGLTHIYSLLLVASFFGTLGTTASETAPFLPIEQAILAQVTDAARRTEVFAHYNLVASLAGAVGALTAAGPDLLSHLGMPLNTGIRFMFGVYAAVALGVALLALRLSSAVEAQQVPPPTPGGRATPRMRLILPLQRSRGIVLRLAGLFSVDAFAGGLIVQSLMALYFHLRFGVPLAPLGALFFGANALSGLSFLAAAPLARRFGLLNTMVFTHLPSNALLILVPLMPTFSLAALILLLRQALSQMDVPTRQAYTMTLVAADERTAAASVTSLARSAGSSSSPVLGGLLLQGPALALGLPFVIAGTLKAAYDLVLWRVFLHVVVPGERSR
jgi:MFS family permease